MRTCIIFCAAGFDRLLAPIVPEDLVIAADGGLKHTEKLGIIYPFARNFGSVKMDQCPYLVTRVTGRRTAEEWAELIADTANLMDSKFRKMEVEKWINPRARQ